MYCRKGNSLYGAHIHKHAKQRERTSPSSQIRPQSSDKGTLGHTCCINVKAKWVAAFQLNPLHHIMCCSLVWLTPTQLLYSSTQPVTLDLQSDLLTIGTAEQSAWKAAPIKGGKKNNTGGLAWLRHGCILILWRHINSRSGRRRSDITGAAAITKDDSGRSDKKSSKFYLPPVWYSWNTTGVTFTVFILMTPTCKSLVLEEMQTDFERS